MDAIPFELLPFELLFIRTKLFVWTSARGTTWIVEMNNSSSSNSSLFNAHLNYFQFIWIIVYLNY